MAKSTDPTDPAARPRSLRGQRVLVTRAAMKVDRLSELLQERGSEVLRHPVIEILPAADLGPLKNALGHLDRYRGLVWTSPNGVRHWFELASESDTGSGLPDHLELVAIGRGTGQAVTEHSGRKPVVPDQSHSESLAAWLIDRQGQAPDQRPWLILRGDRGSQVLPQRLAEAGVPFEQITAYRSRDRTTADPQITAELQQGRIDWVTVTSSAIAAATLNLWGPYLAGRQPESQATDSPRRQARLASISPTTTSVLQQAGWQPSVQAQQTNLEGLVDALELFVDHHRD